ncbi:MAG: ABC transporter permease [Bacteroidales bacterium]|nr:ABC transporter permease [Bacteroidales bacterium]MCF8338592.1 ABC transporter permease [Bacteroidales bacterium]
MFKNFLKIATRNFIRRKSFTFINILGLGIGMAASILIAMWVFHEISYDEFHTDSDRLYRMEREIFLHGQHHNVPVTSALYGPTMVEDMPGVISYMRLMNRDISMKDSKDVFQTKKVIFVDSNFFSFFSFPLLKGNPETVLKEPNSVVLTQEEAKRFFGEKDPINKEIEIEWYSDNRRLKVTGVMGEIPDNSHFQPNILISFSTTEDVMESQHSRWSNNYLYNYIKLDKNTDIAQVESKSPAFIRKHMSHLPDVFNINIDINKMLELNFRPIESIHLTSKSQYDIAPQGSLTSVIIFSIISVLILLIAAFNFMNLSTALAEKRAREVGLRKTIGASKKSLIIQFLGESLLMALIAFILALLLIEMVLPVFNNLLDKNLTWHMLTQTGPLVALIVIVLGTGLLAGLYPAFYLSSYSPIQALKSGDTKKKGGFSFRQVLVTAQFFISISLIIGTITAYSQLSYLQNKPLGFDKENMVILPYQRSQITQEFNTFKGELQKHSSIKSVTNSGSVPIITGFSDTSFETELSDQNLFSMILPVSDDFMETYGLELIAGRGFSNESTMEDRSVFIVNERLVKELGVDDPQKVIGTKYAMNGRDTTYSGRIIGVVKDFNVRPLRHEIRSLTLFPDRNWGGNISVKVADGQMSQALSHIEKTWKDMFPEIFYTYSIMEERVNHEYAAERQMQNILLAFTILTIFIASLGLFGLAAFMARQKSKEIAIRKVLGAETANILLQLNSTFGKWILIAVIPAIPVTWYFLDNWLSNFAYRVNLEWWIFLMAALVSALVALITVSYQSYKAATANPVNAIKYE